MRQGLIVQWCDGHGCVNEGVAVFTDEDIGECGICESLSQIQFVKLRFFEGEVGLPGIDGDDFFMGRTFFQIL
ncbi:MAG: hypothetical protein ACD_62C00104G0003 [uncultured bacterium]|nr:MAG: hypothetical protein ACD_62C00104G0003 [uncultured bacterium]